MGLWITLRMCTRRNFLLFVCSLQLVSKYFLHLSLVCHSLELLSSRTLLLCVWPANIFINNILSIRRVVAFKSYRESCPTSFRSVWFLHEVLLLLSIKINWAFDCESGWNNESYRKIFKKWCYASINFRPGFALAVNPLLVFVEDQLLVPLLCLLSKAVKLLNS